MQCQGEDEGEGEVFELDEGTSQWAKLVRLHSYLGGILALRAHCVLLLDYVPPEEPPDTPIGNALRIR